MYPLCSTPDDSAAAPPSKYRSTLVFSATFCVNDCCASRRKCRQTRTCIRCYRWPHHGNAVLSVIWFERSVSIDMCANSISKCHRIEWNWFDSRQQWSLRCRRPCSVARTNETSVAPDSRCSSFHSHRASFWWSSICWLWNRMRAPFPNRMCVRSCRRPKCTGACCRAQSRADIVLWDHRHATYRCKCTHTPTPDSQDLICKIRRGMRAGGLLGDSNSNGTMGHVPVNITSVLVTSRSSDHI